MTLEEYICKRKKEENINEYDMQKHDKNLQSCVNYVFEYFDMYLRKDPDIEEKLLDKKKENNYRERVSEYSEDVREWLVDFYVKYNKNLEKWITRRINDHYFLLYTEDSEFRNLAHLIYYEIINSIKEIDGNGEMIFKFLKDYHRISSDKTPVPINDVYYYDIDQWIADTYKVYGVNLANFCYEWLWYFEDNEELWEKGRSYTKTNSYSDSLISNHLYETTKYDYKKEGERFGLEALYQNMPKKEFTIDRKKSFEIVMMYIMTHEFYDTDEDYWKLYCSELEKKVDA